MIWGYNIRSVFHVNIFLFDTKEKLLFLNYFERKYAFVSRMANNKSRSNEMLMKYKRKRHSLV